MRERRPRARRAPEGWKLSTVGSEEAPSYRVLWVPVLITLAFAATIVAWFLLPRSDYLSAGHLGPAASAIAAYGYGIVPFALLALVAAGRAIRLERLARREEQGFAGRQRLAPGLATVSGTVDARAAGGEAVRLEIVQTRPLGADIWEERDRSMHLRPFAIVLPDGTALPVEPEQPLRLLDELDRTEKASETRRTRVAALLDGEPVHALGELVESGEIVQAPAGDYRVAPRRTLVLRRPPGGTLLLSTKPMGEQWRRRSRSYRRWLFGTLAVAAIVQLMFAGYHYRVFFGEAATARVESKQIRHPIGPDGERQGTVHEVRLRIGPEWAHEVVIDAETASFARIQQGEEIPVWIAGGSVELGSRPSAFFLALVFEMLLVGGWIILFLLYAGGPKPWYEQRRLEETEPGPAMGE